MTQDEYDEIVLCGRLPRRRDGKIDPYAIDGILQRTDDTSHRVKIIKRCLEHKPRGLDGTGG